MFRVYILHATQGGGLSDGQGFFLLRLKYRVSNT